MPHPCPHHCPPERRGTGAVLLAVLAVIVIAIARAIARPVEHAAELGLEVAVIAVASVGGLAAIGGIAYAALRARDQHATDRQAIARHAPQALNAVQSRTARRAIEAPRPALYVIRPEHQPAEEDRL
jgi:hypothetical protein